MSQTEPLPSNVAVAFSASPTTGLNSGDQIRFEVLATNLGPQTLNGLAITSSDFTNEFEFGATSVDCAGVVLQVSDGLPGPHYNIVWYAALLPDRPLAVGQTTRCAFTLTLSRNAPIRLPFSFSLPDYYVEPDPNDTANNSGTVVFEQVIPSLPATSPVALTVLLVLLLFLANRQFTGYFGKADSGVTR
ncbi:hypothetical protein [Tahibacter amnicola]|uniref:Repeat protein (TIGR01451 family) n=1 Tax=Tahibacter amnicola TaxID=2976241 RepID=A0ABY6BAH5_9GAMM|nr:hypothetical protein [Tahibacter amnicola]UXI66155.1 hypothetical protein N4264_15510 [Tahibacter amnicola]